EVINLCEMKFCANEYEIDADDEENYRNKIETFRRVTGTKHALHFTMVTTYGVKKTPTAE
ncbi:MAG: ATP-binding protein, partial [Bacteroidales bacterium]|nr:ATP-binding protein [Bacteroidales bacterium]